jgi:hypothetical protein
MSTFEVRNADTQTPIEVVLKRRDQTLQPLAGTETVVFTLLDWLNNSLTLNGAGAGVVSDAPNSKVKYVLVAGDTTALRGQVLRGRFKVTFAGGGIETYPTAPDDLVVAVY